MSVKIRNSDGTLITVAGGTLYADAPIGAIFSYGGATAPTGFLLCQGQAISRTDYSELFAAIGTAFGEGDGSSTFNVPDLREATTKGAGLSGKSSNHYDSDGVALGEFVEDRVQEHTHIVGSDNRVEQYFAGGELNINYGAFAFGDITGSVDKLQAKAIDNGRTGATTEVKSVGVNYIIKCVQTAVPVDIKSAVDDMLTEVTDVIPSGASANNKLVTANNIVHKISFKTNAGMTGYYTQTGTLVHVHIDAYKETNWTDWQSLANVGAIPAPATSITNVLTKGSKAPSTGNPVGLYIFATGSIAEAGSGGMVAGSYVWDFIYDTDTGEVVKNNGLIDITTSDLNSLSTSTPSASNKLVTESEISKIGKTLSIGGSAAAIVKIDVSVPFLDYEYGKFTEIDFQVRSDNIRFFISANDGAYLVTAQHNYRSAGWLTGLNYLVNGSKSISLYVSILNYPASVGANLVFNGLDGAEITEISTVSALPSGCALMKQFPIIYASDLTSTVTQNSTSPITSGGVANVAGYCGQYSFDTGTSIVIGMDSTAFRRVTIYQDNKVYSFIVHEWGGTPVYHWILGTELPSGITTSYSGYRLTFTNNSFGTARMVIEAASNPVR